MFTSFLFCSFFSPRSVRVVIMTPLHGWGRPCLFFSSAILPHHNLYQEQYMFGPLVFLRRQASLGSNINKSCGSVVKSSLSPWSCEVKLWEVRRRFQTVHSHSLNRAALTPCMCPTFWPYLSSPWEERGLVPSLLLMVGHRQLGKWNESCCQLDTPRNPLSDGISECWCADAACHWEAEGEL